MPHGSTRLGLFLFAVYLALYGGFVLLAAFAPSDGGHAARRSQPCDLVWIRADCRSDGFALIYGWACRGSARKSPSARLTARGRPAVTHDSSTLAILVFLAVRRGDARHQFLSGQAGASSAGYFAAHGQIPWFVNGVAFAGDYLSAASFLGICGMIAFYGYDGFLYSIGYLAGWVVALFVVAEPMKRLGKFAFADEINSRFQSTASNWRPAPAHWRSACSI